MLEGGQFSLLDQIDKGLSLKKVGIEEFCESEAYCGKLLYPRQKLLLKIMFLEELTGREQDILTYWMKGGRTPGELQISPDIRGRMDYLKERGYKHFREVVLVGGRRSSKGFVTGLALARKLYDTLQLQDPGRHYGIDRDKEIYYACVAASQDQAKKYQYADFAGAVNGCVAMQEYITKIQELELSVATESDRQTIARAKTQNRKIGRDISKLRGVAFAANASTLRGLAAMAIVFDEMAHMQQEGESAATAEQVYEAAIPALAQFGKDAMIFCNSSPYTKLGKFYDRYEESLGVDDEGHARANLMFSFKFPSWALFEGWQDDPQRRFSKAITVSPDWDPDEKNAQGVLWHSEADREAILIAREEERQKPETYKVERRAHFAEVIDSYLRPEAVDRMMAGRPRPNGTLKALRTNFDEPNYLFRYKAHLDPSSTTAGFGFALGHIEEIENQYGDIRSHVVFDIVKRWNPKEQPDGVINWEIVLNEVYRYAELFRPFEITFDQFQSAAPMQWLAKAVRERGMNQIRVYEKTATAQSNWNRAECFRTALYQNRVHAPDDTADAQYAALELKYLQQVNTTGRFARVDKQEIGPVQTKDMADCMMAVVEGLIGNEIARESREGMGNMGMALGGLGGYGIGGSAGIPGRGTHRSGNPFQSITADSGRKQAAFGARERLAALNDPARRTTWQGRGRRSY